MSSLGVSGQKGLRWTLYSVALVVLFMSFQNCSPVSITDLAEEPSQVSGLDTSEDQIVLPPVVSDDDPEPRPLTPFYAKVRVGDAETLPPLNLVFVIDNSGTMAENQINLGKAFEKMFTGDNKRNLAPFQTSSYIINTSQKSLPESDKSFSRLPQSAASSFDGMDYSNFLSTYRGTVLDGKVAGDLVGYSVQARVTDGTRNLTFSPAPVASFFNRGGKVESQLSIQKEKDGSIEAFAQDFRDRIETLNPNRSAIDPLSKTGVLDSVVDSESGLCALGRLFKAADTNQFLRKGELSAFILVSDENDSDPVGKSCIESVAEADGDQEFIDGACYQPRTEISYRPAILNPSREKCEVRYQKGFNYGLTYKAKTVKVDYKRSRHIFDKKQVAISYFTEELSRFDKKQTSISYSLPKYDSVSTPISFFQQIQTYEIPKTSLSFYSRQEVCESIRDGIKSNCTWKYQLEPAIVVDAKTPTTPSECLSLARTRLRSSTGAVLDDLSYPPRCVSAVPEQKVGPCSVSDPNVINCRLVRSAGRTTIEVPGDFAGNCASFVSANRFQLPSNAIVVGTDAPICNTPVVVTKTGTCPSDDSSVRNCRVEVASTPVIAEGIPAPSQSCLSFAVNSRTLPSQAVVSGSQGLPTCSAGPSVIGLRGSCSTSDPLIENCTRVFSSIKERVVDGVIGSRSCADFALSSGLTGFVTGVPGKEPSCSSRLLANQVSTSPSFSCPTNGTVENCRRELYNATRNIEGTLTGTTCANFVRGKLENNAVLAATDPSQEPICSLGSPIAKSVNGNELFSDSKWISYAPKAGDACSIDLTNHAVAKEGLLADRIQDVTCRVSSFVAATPILIQDSTRDVTCEEESVKSICGSDPSKRNCTYTSIPAGDIYSPTSLVRTLNGSFTCESRCSESPLAGECRRSDALLKEEFYQCASRSLTAIKKSDFTASPTSSGSGLSPCQKGEVRVVSKGPYKLKQSVSRFVAGSLSAENHPEALAKYIKGRAAEIYGSRLPFVSVFVRQPGDPLDNNGSLGTAYNQFADMMGGSKSSVLTDADGYAESLKVLSSEIRSRLDRSFRFKAVVEGQSVRRVWLIRRNSSSSLIGSLPPESEEVLLETTQWSASGGTVTLADEVRLDFGDEIKIEFY